MSNNVYPDPDPPAGTTVPSSVPLDSASLISGTISVGAAAGGVMSTAFLIPPSMTASVSWTLPLLARSIPTGYLVVTIIFGALSVILGAINLFWGLSRKKKLAERMRPHQDDLENLCRKAGIPS